VRLSKLRSLLSEMHEDVAKQEILLQTGEVLFELLSKYDEKIRLIKHIEEMEISVTKFLFDMLDNDGNFDLDIMYHEYRAQVVDVFGHQTHKIDTILTLNDYDVKGFLPSLDCFSNIVDAIFKENQIIDDRIKKVFVEREKFIEHTQPLAKEHADKWAEYLIDECGFSK